MSGGVNHACAVTTAGGVQCWGSNGDGELGDGTTIDRGAPVSVIGLSSGVAAVSAGAFHTCALTATGGVVCWGDNSNGQLGDGTTNERHVPVDVTGLTSGVVAVSSGAFYTCALTTAGGAKCWGFSGYGRLGDGTTTERHTPVDVVGLTTGVAAISTGQEHACALTTAGGVKCWGWNGGGQLGDGTTNSQTTPVWVSGLTEGVAAVSAGGRHTCAVTTAGGAKCWGFNASGELGDGTTTDRHTPTNVVGLTTGVSAISTGFEHSCARTTAGGATCWGSNAHGSVGNATTTDQLAPAPVVGLSTGLRSIEAGDFSTCAVSDRAGVQCWGSNSSGQLGDGTTTDRVAPNWLTGYVGGTGQLAAGGNHTCRLTSAGGVQCWGENAQGEVGDGTTNVRRTPVDVAGLASGMTAVAAGFSHTCALTTAGGLKCWGDNSYGQLGDGTTTRRLTPVDVSGLTSGVVAVAAGERTTCAVMVAGSIQCWGYNGNGQVGDGTTANRSTPVRVGVLSSGATAVAIGASHACALSATGGAWCWGGNSSGQLGDASTSSRGMPAPAAGLLSGIIALSTGAAHTCALTSGLTLTCWGGNSTGQVGDGTNTNRPTPVAVGMSRAATVGAGTMTQCAVQPSGSMMCWGWNLHGQVGDGTTTDRNVPWGWSSDLPLGTVTVGHSHACAWTATGLVECWGAGGAGQLGDGTGTERHSTTVVRGFKQDDDYDADRKADVSVYRPSTGTWFSLNSSSGNASYQYRGWGVQGMGDIPVPGCDFDGDGIVDPTVFRPSVGTWFIKQSSTSFTTWDHFGWGTTGDTPVPADYDGDGITDAAVYRPSEGKWYVRPSSGATQWNLVFGNATDVPIPGHFDADGQADIAVYRPSTGTWFVLPSSLGYASYWYKGWGVNAQGDVPAPGDYDGDGKLDLCVFRPTTGTWFILESHASFTTWSYFGWGASGDTVVPADYDGDGITDAAVYRPSNYTWYVRPSSGATQWSKPFGQAGDVPLITIR